MKGFQKNNIMTHWNLDTLLLMKFKSPHIPIWGIVLLTGNFYIFLFFIFFIVESIKDVLLPLHFSLHPTPQAFTTFS